MRPNRSTQRSRTGIAAIIGAGLLAVVIHVNPTQAAPPQVVYLDFTSTGHSIAPADVHIYTAPEKAAIKSYLEGLYSPYGIVFTLAPPPPSTASTIHFNHGPLGGFGDQLDFRNVDTTDDAYINAIGMLGSFVGAPNPFVPGNPPLTPGDLAGSGPITISSANLAAHELGHILGLRHHDGFGPVGGGVAVSGYDPTYPGPTDADTTSFHIMSLSSSVALSPATLLSPSYLSQRSAIKLFYNEVGPVIVEGPGFHNTPETAADIALLPMIIPNPLKAPEPDAGITPTFTARAIAVSGSLVFVPETGSVEGDYYKFTGFAGDVITIEVIAAVMGPDLGGRIADPIDSVLFLLDAGPGFLPFPFGAGMTANFDEFESTDSVLMDFTLPYTGDYVIEVGTALLGPGAAGSYEMFVYMTRAITVPEPGTAAMATLAASLTLIRRCRRRPG